MDEFVLDDDGNAVEATDLLTWAKWFETANRVLAKDKVGDATVSTIFLGLDHSFGSSPPVLWETMIFGGEYDEHQERYASRAEALAGHSRAVALARKGKHMAPAPVAAPVRLSAPTGGGRYACGAGGG